VKLKESERDLAIQAGSTSTHCPEGISGLELRLKTTKARSQR
jgi:hypothetical protein